MEKLGINVTWLAAQIINFGLLLFLLWRFAYKPVLGMMNARKKKIQDSLDYAEQVKRDAAAQQKEFERRLEETKREAQAAAQAAAQVGEKEREAILAQAREEARKLVEQAKEQIEDERRKMMAELHDEIVRLSLLAASKVVGASMDERIHRQLVSDFIAQADKASGNGH